MIKRLHHFFQRHVPGYYRCYKLALSTLWFVRSMRALQSGSVPRFLWLRMGGGKAGECYALHFRGHAEPAWVRAKSSDIHVFEQMFLKQEYSEVPLINPEWIVDAGANIGLAALYFLLRYPTARVLAIEPSPTNFAVMEQNLAPHARRCSLLRAAVWCETGHVALQFADVPRAEWAIQVQAAAHGDVPAFDMATLMQRFGINRISLLKMDVEGAEAEIFAANTSWLSQVEMMAIELHGPRAVEIVEAKARACFASVRQDREIRIYAQPQ
jgi:FkbM family methyltransferase